VLIPRLGRRTRAWKTEAGGEKRSYRKKRKGDIASREDVEEKAGHFIVPRILDGKGEERFHRTRRGEGKGEKRSFGRICFSRNGMVLLIPDRKEGSG